MLACRGISVLVPRRAVGERAGRGRDTQPRCTRRRTGIAGRCEGTDNAPFQAAMKTVLVRVTGRRYADEDPALAPLVSNARRYVQQYRAAPDNQLWVAFDGPAIERWLTQNGQPLWGHERPATLVLVGGANRAAVRQHHQRR